MSDSDLSRLSSQSFERLVRALAFRLMGPAGTVFGPGPDGGRDFTFEGKIRGYESRGWDGYLILQAKFRLRTQDGQDDPTQKDDISWLQSQIDLEELKFSDKSIGLRKPDYYIVATNVILSGADGRGARGHRRTGGHTKVSKSLSGWKKSVGLKDFDIWPASKIIDLLDGAADIRQTYATWVTAGDVLTEALDRMKVHNPSFPDVIRRAMKKAIRRDQYARLQDAGSTATNIVRMGQVFVDLPATRHMDTAEAMRTPRWRGGILAHLVERAKDQFDRTSMVADDAMSPDGTLVHTIEPNNKIVILGGPGQGKSTVSTFAAQLFRSINLVDDFSASLDALTHPIIKETVARALAEKIPTSLPRRYPVLVNLPRYADDITEARKNGVNLPSLLTRISSDLSRDADTSVNREHLRHWMRINPWLLILDGLDEVPPSGERAAIIQAIEDMEVEVSELSADVLFIVTTRPQGYNRDLDPLRWEHWALDDLNPRQALLYAEALTAATYPDDFERRQDILNSLTEAAARPATSRLLRSPLQVTIMQLIVDTGGSAPRARWSLFQQYFEVLTKREKAKGGPTRAAIERHEGQLGPIHHLVGLILHIDSETTGGAGASLDRSRFIQLIVRYLRDEGYDAEDSETRADELADLAVNRLVLLTPQERENIGFEVRSLQEFMAAAALTSGDPGKVQERMAQIAGIAHWRHAFLIAASRCFAENVFHYQRSAICALPRQLELSSEDDLTIKNGSRLALEMFEDGIGLDHPISRRSLCQHALELLALGPTYADHRLRLLLEPNTCGLFERTLRERLRSESSKEALAAWRLSIEVANQELVQAASLVHKNVPSDAIEILAALGSKAYRNLDAATISAVRSRFLEASPGDLQFGKHPIWQAFQDDEFIVKAPQYAELTRLNLEKDDYLEKSRIVFKINNFGGGLSIRIISVRAQYPEGLRDLIGGSCGWGVVASCARFAQNPNQNELSKILQSISESAASFTEARRLLRYLPWPIACIVRVADSVEMLGSLAEDAADGAFGCVTDWELAEARWIKHGINSNDLLRSSADGRYFSSDVADIGVPYGALTTVTHHQTGTKDQIVGLARLMDTMPENNVKSDFYNILVFGLLGLGDENVLTESEEAHAIIKLLDRAQSGALFIKNLQMLSVELWNNDDVVEGLSRNAYKCVGYGSSAGDLDIDMMIEAFLRRPIIHRGLLLGIAAYLCSEKDRSKAISLAGITIGDVQPNPQDEPSIASAAAILRILLDESEILDAVEILSSEGGEWMGIRLIRNLLARDQLSVSAKRTLASELIKRDPLDDAGTGQFINLLKSTLDRRSSDLSHPAVWRRLELPETAFPILMGSDPQR